MNLRLPAGRQECMRIYEFKKYFILNLIVLTLFIADRITKLWFVNNPGYARDFIVGFLSFHREKNFGLAFGWPVNPMLAVVLIVLAILGLMVVLLRAYRRADDWLIFSLSLIVAGAFSNLIDRFKYGFVVDYIAVPFFTVFNLADIMISAGVGLIIVKELFFKNQK